MASRRVRIWVLLGCMLLWVSGSSAVDAERRPAGLSLVAAEATTVAALPTPTSQQQVVRYDYRFLREGERAEPEYLLLPKKPDVELLLVKAPVLEEKAENGFPALRLELTPAAARDLERLSREHLGQRVAFLVDGEPVTTHKIRSVITDGQLRITRCTDRACQYIYGRLAEQP